MVRLSRVMIVSAVLILSACASTSPTVVEAPVEVPAVVEVAIQPSAQKDALGAYRFNMSEGEKKMTADEFDAWMKANGIRVARGTAAPAVSVKEEKKE